MKRSGNPNTVWRLLRGDRRRVAWLSGAIVVTTVAELALPYLLGVAIDDGITEGELSVVVIVGIAYLAIAAVLYAGTSTYEYLSGRISQGVLRELQVELREHLDELPMGYFERTPPGQVISRLTNDVDAVQRMVATALPAVVASVLLGSGTVVMLFVLDVLLATVATGAFVCMIAATVLYRRTAKRQFRKTRSDLADVTAYVQQMLGKMRTVFAFGQDDRHLAEFERTTDRYRSSATRASVLTAGFVDGLMFIPVAAKGAVLLVGGYQVIDGEIDIGVVVAFVAYLQNFFGPVRRLSNLLGSYYNGVAALSSIYDVLDEPAEADVPPAAGPLVAPAGDVCFDRVWFAYEGDGWVVRDVSFEAPVGSTVALVGETGAGKSTLAKLLLRFHDPQRGRISIGGVDLATLPRRATRSGVGYVPQTSFLFNGSIRDNIRFARPEATDADVAAVVDAIGAGETLGSLPDGLNTAVGERGELLSSGQRQLVALARALIVDPGLVILDEATAQLDPISEAAVRHGLRTLLEGRTALVIAHRLSTIRDADMIVVVEDGRIAEQGTRAELLEAGGRYARLEAARGA